MGVWGVHMVIWSRIANHGGLALFPAFFLGQPVSRVWAVSGGSQVALTSFGEGTERSGVLGGIERSRRPPPVFRLPYRVPTLFLGWVGRESCKVATPSGIQWGAADSRGFRNSATESDARAGELQG